MAIFDQNLINDDEWVPVRGMPVRRSTVARLEEEVDGKWITDNEGVLLLGLDCLAAEIFLKNGFAHPRQRMYVINLDRFTWRNIPVEAIPGLPAGETSGKKKMWFRVKKFM